MGILEILHAFTKEYLEEILKFCSQFVHHVPGVRIYLPPALKKTFQTEEAGILRLIQRLQHPLGPVAGRATTEDVRVRIDKACEDIFRDLLQKYQRRHGLRVRVFSEHGNYGNTSPKYLCAIDPFDGSGIFRRGLPKEWYSVLTFFDLDGEPLCGGSVDILQKEIYLATLEGVVRIPLREEEKGNKVFAEDIPIKVSPSRKRILNENIVIAAYLMNRDYRRTWEEGTKRLGDKFPGLLVWPNGGACIYHHIASGEVDAYVMFKEPRSEIDPGLAFAHCSPFPVFSVQKNWVLQPYRFSPGTQAERVPFLVAACTEELAKSIVASIRPS